MTKLMEKAFKKASNLPENMQDLIAKDLIDEIEWETQWDKAFEDTQSILDKLAGEALDEYNRGETENIGFEKL